MKYLKTLVVIIIALAIVLVSQHYLGSAKLPQRPPMNSASLVLVDTVSERQFATRIEALGTTYANESVTITAPVSERISAVLFESGTEVKAGDLLVQLENAEELAQVAEARISLEEEQREFVRIKGLLEKKIVSEQELDYRRSATAAAEARLAAAQARLQDRAILAPFDGILGMRTVSPGAFVTPGTAITTLDDLHLIKVDFSIPETLLAAVEIGQTIEAVSAAMPDETLTGAVASINSRVNPTTRAVSMQAHIPNTDRRLRPGMLVTVTLISNERIAAGIPEKAVVAYGDKNYAFVYQQDNTVSRREVQLGQREIGWVEIQAGLQPGELIVVEGVMDLKDGAKVRVAETSTTTAPNSSPTT